MNRDEEELQRQVEAEVHRRRLDLERENRDRVDRISVAVPTGLVSAVISGIILAIVITPGVMPPLWLRLTLAGIAIVIGTVAGAVLYCEPWIKRD